MVEPQSTAYRAYALRNKLDIPSNARFQCAPDGEKRYGVGWTFVCGSWMWNAEAGSLMNFRRNRAPATAPASYIFPSRQSRSCVPAVSHPHPTYATRNCNEACQSASHRYSKRCRHLPQLIYTCIIPPDLCIGLSYTVKHLSQLTLAFLPTPLQDPTHLDQHKHTHKHLHPYPSSNADTRRKNSIVSQSDPQASRQQTCTSPLDLPCWLHALPSACKLYQSPTRSLMSMADLLQTARPDHLTSLQQSTTQ